jgi:hypothetical protein
LIYQRKNDVLVRRIAGETLLVPIAGRLADLQRLFVLEGAGEFIWENLDGKSSLDEIRDSMVRHFEVSAEEAAEDLGSFVRRLRDAGLILEVA